MALLLSFMAYAALAQAGEPRLMAAYDAWEVYVYREEGHKVCYIASQPGNVDETYTKLHDSFALMTDREEDHSKDVFAYVPGYAYKVGTPIHLIIDTKDFTLVPRGDRAWTPDSKTDHAVAEAIRNGKDMKIVATSRAGKPVTEMYSLKGSGKAYAQLLKECR